MWVGGRCGQDGRVRRLCGIDFGVSVAVSLLGIPLMVGHHGNGCNERGSSVITAVVRAIPWSLLSHECEGTSDDMKSVFLMISRREAWSSCSDTAGSSLARCLRYVRSIISCVIHGSLLLALSRVCKARRVRVDWLVMVDNRHNLWRRLVTKCGW